MPPAQSIASCLGQRISEYGQQVCLHTPEAVSIVAAPREALCGYGPLFGASSRLHDLKESKAYCLLQLRIAVHFHVRPFPNIIEVPALTCEKSVPARPFRRG